MSDALHKGLLSCTILLLLQLLTYVAAQGRDGTVFDAQRCPTWPHLRAMVRHGSSPTTAMHCISAEEARLMREATRGMSGGGTPTRSNSGISPVAGPTFPQPGLGPSAGRGTPGLFPGLESPLGETSPIDTRGGLTPGRFDPFRSTGTGSGPTFPGGSPMQPGFPGSDPSRPTFPGASPAVGPSQMGSSGLDPFSPEIRPGGGPPGRAVSGLMGARPLGQPPRFPGSLASGPGGRSSFTDPMTGGPPMPGGPTGMDTPFPGSGASGPGGPPGAGDGTPRPIVSTPPDHTDCREPCQYHTQCPHGEFCYNKHPCNWMVCQVPT